MVFIAAALAALVPIVSRALPWTRANETYRTVFSKEVFRSKIHDSAPVWMLGQIDRDFQDFKDKVSANAIETTFRTVCERVGPATFCHYRILNNELYKFVPTGTSFSDTDTPLEKALWKMKEIKRRFSLKRS